VAVSRMKAGAWAAGILLAASQSCDLACGPEPCADWIIDACRWARALVPLAVAFSVSGLRDAITKHGFMARSLRRKPVGSEPEKGA